MLVTSFRYHGPWTSGDPEHSFSASDLRTFGFTDVPPVEPPAGTRSADPIRRREGRPDRHHLAEHRPGSSDLFVLTLDICTGP
jgi:hypothetical protein